LVKKQIRDNNYYIQRLKKVAPDLHSRVMAGEITVTKARQLAGLGGTRGRLSELKNSWRKATPAERRTFLVWVSSLAAMPRGAFDPDGLMRPWASKRISQILVRRMMSSGDLSQELGLKRLDASVAMAMQRNVRVKESTRVAVEKWLEENAHV
jgi:hypothetical protein